MITVYCHPIRTRGGGELYNVYIQHLCLSGFAISSTLEFENVVTEKTTTDIYNYTETSTTHSKSPNNEASSRLQLPISHFVPFTDAASAVNYYHVFVHEIKGLNGIVQIIKNNRKKKKIF